MRRSASATVGSEDVVIEDSENGVRSAARADAHVLALDTDVNDDMDLSSADELAEDGADLQDRILAALDGASAESA